MPRTGTQAPPQDRPRPGVKQTLLRGVFWRILIIEAILMVWSVGWRAFSQGGTALELGLYALRITALVGVIILFVWLTLTRFLVRKIIRPLETIAAANRRMEEDDPERARIELPPDTPREIGEIAATRDRMLGNILKASTERLRLVKLIRETFSRYVSAEVADEVLGSPEARRIGGRLETVTIMMSDLRGFVSLSENRDPEEMVRLLNRYLGRMSEVIFTRRGLIDEFIGDAILVVFGAPVRRDDDSLRAVACGLEMQLALRELNQEIAAEGHPPLEMGIGINTGQVIVGNIGSDKRVKYGFVGSAVNTASRIEANSTGGQVLIGEATYESVRDKVTVDPPQTVVMKGLHRPLVFYPVRAVGPPYGLSLPLEERGGEEFRLDLPFDCWLVDGKKVVGRPCSGRTLSLSKRTIKARLETPFQPLSDLRLKLQFCVDAHCFEDIYAKVTGLEEGVGGPVHELTITSMAPEDRELLERWTVEAG